MARDSRSTFRQQNKKKRDKAKIRNREEMGAGEDNKDIVLTWCFPGESCHGLWLSPISHHQILASRCSLLSSCQLVLVLPWYECGAALGDQPSTAVALWAR